MSVKTNLFVYKQNEKYTFQQKEIFQLIKSLQEKGLGYRKISQYLNEKGLTTHKGNKWGNNNVYSVVKRHRERENRLRVMKKIYQPNWGKMKVIWERNQD